MSGTKCASIMLKTVWMVVWEAVTIIKMKQKYIKRRQFEHRSETKNDQF